MQSTKFIRKSVQSGFTLIELVVVIVILGILAATALPKFADLGADARAAKMNGLRGAMSSAAGVVHAQWLAQSIATTVTSLTVGGTAITINSSGYPTNDLAGIGAAVGMPSTGADFVLDATTSAWFPSTADITSHTNCKVTYTATTGAVSAALTSSSC